MCIEGLHFLLLSILWPVLTAPVWNGRNSVHCRSVLVRYHCIMFGHSYCAKCVHKGYVLCHRVCRSLVDWRVVLKHQSMSLVMLLHD